jgi:hypothetical protein
MTYAEDQLKSSPAPYTGIDAPASFEQGDTITGLEQIYESLEQVMAEIETTVATLPQLSNMPEIVVEQTKWRAVRALVQPEATLAAALRSGATVARLLELLAPSLVMPNPPLDNDLSVERLHTLRQSAEQFKENLRDAIAAQPRPA